MTAPRDERAHLRDARFHLRHAVRSLEAFVDVASTRRGLVFGQQAAGVCRRVVRGCDHLLRQRDGSGVAR